jgi:dipeptidyl-peptidase-4
LRVSIITLLLLCPVSLATRAPAQEKLTLTLEQASGRDRENAVSFGDDVPAWSWAWDGVHLVRGRGAEAVWVDPETLEESPPQEQPEAERAAEAAPSAQLLEALAGLGLDEKEAERIARGRSRVSADGRTRLVRRDGELYWVRDDDEAAIAGRLPAQAAEGVELEELAPDGMRLAYVQANDLVVLDLVSAEVREVTDNGSDEWLNGKLDWVYQEELYGRGNFKAFWWSPTSTHIVFLESDESAVYEFTVVDHIEPGTFRVKPEVSKYPKAGDPNPTVTVAIVDVASGDVVRPDLSRYADAGEFLIVRAGWNPSGDRCLFMVQDRIQTWLELVSADPVSGATRVLLREESDAWVERPAAPRWLADGTFLWESDRTGQHHLYHYQADGTLIGAVTSGPWSVGRIAELDVAAGTLRFSATEGGAINSNHYRINLDGSGFTRLTPGPGRHSISSSADGRFILDRVSTLEEPTRVRLLDGDGRLLRELAHGTVPAEETHHVGRWELHAVPARDGFLLDAALLKPTPFEASARYPVWISTYSGPDAPSVRNAWNSSAWLQFLAQHGVIVLQVNVRTASGKGHEVISQCYKQLGIQEVRDMADAVDWLCAHPWADASRVGITGYSYGGFMTAACMTQTDKFALGIAGGAVYDWGMYDTIYTERYMSTPQLNPEGYAKTSCLANAKDLSGFLYMHAGVMDDNVHVQNTFQMAYALMKAGKANFELMVYPQMRHGIGDADMRWYARQKEWQLIRETLLQVPPSN